MNPALPAGARPRHLRRPFVHEPPRVSDLLAKVGRELPPAGLTVEELLERLGERGLLVLTMLLVVPFLLPVSIPGSSVPFALTIAFVGVGLLLDRTPWLPARLLERRVPAERLERLLERGTRVFRKLERLTKPRLLLLTDDHVAARVIGALIVIGSLLLMMPLPLPLSNTIPAYAILFLAAGRLERDGILVIAGYLLLVLSGAYFTAVGLYGTEAVKAAARHLFGGGAT